MSDDVVVNITVGAAPIAAFAFGIPLLATTHSVSPDRMIGPFTAPSELVDAGFAGNAPAVQWATALMSQRPRPTRFMIGRRDVGDANLTESLDEIESEGAGAWYATFIDTRTYADIAALAAWTEPRLKVAIAQASNEELVGGAGDDFAGLAETGYHQTALIYHPTDAEYLDGAWGGRGLGADLEQVQGAWSHRQLSGVPGTNLSTPQKAAIEEVNANYYAPKAMTSGAAIGAYTFPGIALSGRLFEQTVSIHWLQARLEEALHAPFLNPNGVPFDDTGFALFEAKASGVFGRGLRIGHLVARVSEATGRRTPYLDVVGLDDVDPGDEAAARVRLSGEVHVGKKARRVVLNVVANLGA